MTPEDMRKELFERLQTAAELEMATIPPYLTALLSIKGITNRGAAENIRSVMTEEMLHLALVSNVMSSIGGSLRLTGEHIPRYPLQLKFQGRTFGDRQFEVDLAPFTKLTVETFMAIEQPRAPKAALLDFQKITIPEYTIGEFYDRIVALLEALDDGKGPPLFVGDPSVQISEDYYWSAGGKPVVVKDIGSAKAALHIVIQQGEGSSESVGGDDPPPFGESQEVAHYYRFREIYCERRYASSDKPGTDPTGDPLPVDFSTVYPIKINAISADYVGTPLAALNDDFNRQYTGMLIQLEEALNGNPKTLYTAIMNGMHGLSELAIKMMAMPISSDEGAPHGCPTFEWLRPQI